MKWTITVSGPKKEALKLAGEAADRNIAAGNQTEAQKTAVLAAINALPGPGVSGSISSPADGSTSNELVSTLSSAANTGSKTPSKASPKARSKARSKKR